MKLIVDIPNSLYANLRIITHGSPASKRLLECMKEGIPLPKCHGDLADKGDILHDIDWEIYNKYCISCRHEYTDVTSDPCKSGKCGNKHETQQSDKNKRYISVSA